MSNAVLVSYALSIFALFTILKHIVNRVLFSVALTKSTKKSTVRVIDNAGPDSIEEYRYFTRLQLQMMFSAFEPRPSLVNIPSVRAPWMIAKKVNMSEGVVTIEGSCTAAVIVIIVEKAERKRVEKAIAMDEAKADMIYWMEQSSVGCNGILEKLGKLKVERELVFSEGTHSIEMIKKDESGKEYFDWLLYAICVEHNTIQLIAGNDIDVQLDLLLYRNRWLHCKDVFNYEKTSECMICYERNCNCIVTHCGHFISCFECTLQLKTCPICREPIESFIQSGRE